MLLLVLASALAAPLLTEKMLETLNAVPERTWTAGISPRLAGLSKDEIRAMLIGPELLRPVSGTPVEVAPRGAEPPAEWDLRKERPECVSPVRDQGNCGSCWSFSAVSSFSDRRCVAALDPEVVMYSPQYQVSCDKVNAACAGGNLVPAWDFFLATGLPTDECVPYSKITQEEGYAGICPKQCEDNSTLALTKSSAGGVTFKRRDHKSVMNSIATEGPVTAGMSVYVDFTYYESGIYNHFSGELLGLHAISIVGYGSEHYHDYWIVRNSWGPDWGEGGFFRIMRGHNECGIEDFITAGKV